jgi:O-antigen/teichoic acid export membrane protein
MEEPSQTDSVQSERTDTSKPISQIRLIFRNVSVNYLVTGTELLIGLFMLPFNVAHLGQSAYGLWVLAASVTVYFSMLDMGYGVAQVRFAAHYRAKRDTEALNQIASTMFCVFTAVGLAAYTIAVVIALNLESFFRLTADQATTGRGVLLMVSAYVALGFPFSVFGGIVNGFQRTYLNGIVAFITAVVVALVNVLVLRAGYGLFELVAATTSVRILSYFGYALNAYRVFPALRIRLKSFSWVRLREVTGFSVFILLIDLANKLNYSTDTIVIGIFLSTVAVAVWAVAQRLIEIVQRITDQLNSALFPVVVDSSTIQHTERLQKILLQGTRLSLAMVVPLATGLALLARPAVITWVGADFAGSIPIIHVLSIAVAIRVGNATSSMILKGSGEHRLLAIANIVMAVSNLLLSLLLVQWYGLIGVAVGTLLPLMAVSLLVVFPAACRRVQMRRSEVIRKAVWPATWPALIMAGFLLMTRNIFDTGWTRLFVQTATAGTIYVGLFLRFAISESERDWYFTHIRRLINPRSPVGSGTELGITS